MTADVIPLVSYLTTEARVTAIERMAHGTAMTDAGKAAELRRIAHPSLTGPRLWLAWLAAENAILVCDRTDPDDCDYGSYQDQADIAISVLVHGNYGSDVA